MFEGSNRNDNDTSTDTTTFQGSPLRCAGIIDGGQKWRNSKERTVVKENLIAGVCLLLTSFYQQILEVQKSLFGRVHVNKSRRNAGFPTPTSTPNLMHIIFNLLGHGKYDDVLDVIEI